MSRRNSVTSVLRGTKHRRLATLVAALCGLALLLTGCAGTPEAPAGPQEPLAFPAPPEEARFRFERTLLGTGAVKPLGREERLKELLTGVSARTGTAFSKPFDVAVWRGRVYLSDTVQRVVFILDFPGGRTLEVGNRGDDGDLHKPLGVAVDDQGTLYVVDATLRKVMIYDQAGNFLRSVGGPDTLDRPSGLDVDPAGTRLYVVDTGGVDSEHHGVQILDATSGRSIRDLRRRGTGEGEFNLPRDVRLGPDGLLYVTDGGNFRVEVIDQNGSFVRAWGEPGRRFGQFTRPKGVAVDGDGRVYVVDAAFGNFQIFTPEGQLLLFIGERSERGGPAKYMLPAGIDVDEDGRVYVIDQYFRKLEVFRPAHLAEEAGHLATTPTTK